MLNFKSHPFKENLPSGVTTVRIHLPEGAIPYEWFDFCFIECFYFLFGFFRKDDY